MKQCESGCWRDRLFACQVPDFRARPQAFEGNVPSRHGSGRRRDGSLRTPPCTPRTLERAHSRAAASRVDRDRRNTLAGMERGEEAMILSPAVIACCPNTAHEARKREAADSALRIEEAEHATPTHVGHAGQPCSDENRILPGLLIGLILHTVDALRRLRTLLPDPALPDLHRLLEMARSARSPSKDLFPAQHRTTLALRADSGHPCRIQIRHTLCQTHGSVRREANAPLCKSFKTKTSRCAERAATKTNSSENFSYTRRACRSSGARLSPLEIPVKLWLAENGLGGRHHSHWSGSGASRCTESLAPWGETVSYTHLTLPTN